MLLNEYNFTEREAVDLENLIDKRGLECVLQQISAICGMKSEHIAANWQDTILAQRWATMEGTIGCASTKATGL